MSEIKTGDSCQITPDQRQLFIDDSCVEQTRGLVRTMHQPAKKGAVIRPNPLVEESLQTRCAPAWDPEEELYKILIIGGAGTSYAESRDGLHWTKPPLYQKEVNKTTANNYVTIDPALEWPQNGILNMVYDPDEKDSSRRFKALGYCVVKTEKLNFDHQPLVSPDCRHWRTIDVPLIPSGDESNLSYDRVTKTFLATVKQSGPYGRSVFLSTSRDFEKWSQPELVFHADDEDQARGRRIIEDYVANNRMQPKYWHPTSPDKFNVDVYNMGVFAYEGIYLGLPAMFHSIGPVANYPNSYGFHIIQLVSSRDLKKWQRCGERQPFIAPSPKEAGAYDLTQILPPSAPLIRGEELWFYYTGIKYRGEYSYIGQFPDGKSVAFKTNEKDGGAICLAVLRRDGFISLDAAQAGGSLTTRPFILKGNEMKVNVDAFKGSLKVRIHDLADHTIAESGPISGDSPRAAVLLPDNAIRRLNGRKVKLEFELEEASLYSFWFED
jgi:hypothetical protein